MKRLRVLVVCFVFLLSGKGPLLFAAEEPVLNVFVKMDQTTLQHDMLLRVKAGIRNKGATTITLQLWSCSFHEHWIADVPFVNVQVLPCRKNVLNEVILKPGEMREYDLTLRVQMTPKDADRDFLTFRLGFINGNEDRSSAPPALWSEPITLRR